MELQDDFNPTSDTANFLAKGEGFNFGAVTLEYASTRKTLFNWKAEATKGNFYSGKIQFVEGQVGYRFQPYVNLSMNFNYTDMDLGAPFDREKFFLIGPKMDITFSDKIFWTTFVQYNKQVENLNINSRFQWRYQPVSDIFLVYTDNYFTGSWISPGRRSLNRALVLKVTYWFN